MPCLSAPLGHACACLTGTRGMTRWTRYPAVLAMRLAPHEGQNPSLARERDQLLVRTVVTAHTQEAVRQERTRDTRNGEHEESIVRERGRIVDAEQKVSVRFGKPRGACDTSDEVASDEYESEVHGGSPGADREPAIV